MRTLKKLGQSAEILYDENGHVDQNIVNILKSSTISSSMTRVEKEYCTYDISGHYMTDGKIDLNKLQTVETELRELMNKLETTCEYPKGRCIIASLYNAIKANPEQEANILDMAQKCGMFGLGKSTDYNGKGLDVNILKYYASIPTDLYNVLKENDWLDPYIKGEPATKPDNWYIQQLKPEDIEVLKRHCLDLDYILAAKENQFNRASDVTPQAQTRFEQAIESLDKPLSTADVSHGIELEYSREQFIKLVLKN